jgi:carbon-monoxide dehydrogenase medium subunit
MMNAALAEPEELVSLSGIAELQGISDAPQGGLRIGAMTRHRETAADARLSGQLAVLGAAAGAIANPVVRNMGTIGGSIAFADPAADYPPALVAVGAEVEIASPQGRRRVPADAFFVDWYTTALAPGEMVSAVLLPPAAPGAGVYEKLARVSGDFAIVSVALSVRSEGGACSGVGLAIGGAGPRPVHSAEAETMLRERNLDPKAASRAGALLAELADPVDDVRATAAYRRRVIPRLVARAAEKARGLLSAGAA